MTKSDLLRVEDVRDAFRLLGDCRDLGSDPALWFPRLLEGLRETFGARSATGGEGRVVRAGGPIEPTEAFQAGLDGPEYDLYVRHLRRGGPARDPMILALGARKAPLATHTRKEILPDAVWYRSELFNENFRPTGIDHRLASLHRAPSGKFCGLSLDRAIGDRDFSPRERQLLGFFHEELGRLVGGALASANDPSPDSLAPRLRQTLACLLEGDSEKQIAARLSLSHATVHQYVTTLYRRFGVQSRGQLLAYVMKRKDRWHPATSSP